MSKTISLGLIVLLTAIVAGGGAYWFASRPQVDVDVTVESITKIAKLATIQYRVSSIVETKEVRETDFWKKNFTQEYVCTVKGLIEGKVNLKKADIKVEKGDDGSGQIIIRFGEGSVEVSQLQEDEDGIKIKKISDAKYMEKYQFTEDQRNALITTARKETRKEAIKDGIVTKTQEEAVTLISEFVGALGWSAVVEFDNNAFAG